ncbi:MAG: YidC/Oxa1 family membrane protein insertase [Woeseiaceae bacterium]
MVQAFAQCSGSILCRIHSWLRVIGSILPVALLLVAGNSGAQELKTEVHNCANLLSALREYTDSGSATPRATSPQCANGIVQADLRLQSGIRHIDLAQLSEIVKDQYRFFGLAGYYGSVSINVLNESGYPAAQGDNGVLADEVWLAITGRYKVLGIEAPGAVLSVTESVAQIEWPPGTNINIRLVYGEKERVAEQESVFDATRYGHLWGWLAALSKLVEKSLETLHDVSRLGWGWSIVMLAVALKILLLPVSFLTVHAQRQVSNNQRILEPRIRTIKAEYDGEQAHTRIMQAHKDLGVNPFFTLKPMLGLLIQIPVLIAVFNALGEMPQLIGADFMWIESLAYPDSVATMPFVIPMLGDAINILPVLMTVVTLFATATFRNSVAPKGVVRTQKTQLYFMAAAFFALFYTFPAAMVWYWTATNGLQLAQQRLLKI